MGTMALNMGFDLGNHSYSHPHFSSITMFRARREIYQTDKLIKQLYYEAEIREYPRLFRFPYGDKGDGRRGRVLTSYRSVRGERRAMKIQKYLEKLGYQSCIPSDVTYEYYRNNLGKDKDLHWTLDSMDWSLKNTKPTGKQWSLNDVKRRFFSMNPLDLRGLLDEQFYGLPYSGSAEIVLAHDHPETLTAVKHLVNQLLELGMEFKSLTGNTPLRCNSL